jgi:hypothetical protein
MEEKSGLKAPEKTRAANSLLPFPDDIICV